MTPSPHSVRFGKRIAADIAALCPDAEDRGALTEAVIHHGQLIGADPTVGVECQAPGKFRYLVFQFQRRTGVNVALTLSYEMLSDGELVILSCRRLEM